MRPFYQSIVGFIDDGPPETWGDCTRAAIASVLEIDPVHLPNPHATGLDWGIEWMKALAPFGVQPVWIGDMQAWWKLGFVGYWVATVVLEREDLKHLDVDVEEERHCVVMLHDQLVHDPTQGSILWEWEPEKLRKRIEAATIFVPVDPKRGVVR